jgi:aldose 1-epimerase
MTVNNGENALHGGRDPYYQRLWDVRIPFSKVGSGDLMYALASESISDGSSIQARSNLEDKQVTFCLDSPDGDQGFPGNLHLEVTYRLKDDNSLAIEYRAVSDADTPVGFTNHSYFNLSGHSSGSVLQHIAEIRADYFTPSDSGLLPTGAVQDVSGTPMDFREPKMLGADINSDYDALKFGNGYDHNYVVCDYAEAVYKPDFREIASLVSPDTGITMKVLTDMPGVQLYTANGLHGQVGKGGAVYEPRSGVCFETQFWPDTVNKRNFPGGILHAGETFRSETEYKFTAG